MVWKGNAWEIPKPPGKRVCSYTTVIPVYKAQWTQSEMERLITAAQGQALNSWYYNKHIMEEGQTDRCRLCHM